MTTRTTAIASTVLVLFLGGLVAADAYYTKGALDAQVMADDAADPSSEQSASQAPETFTGPDVASVLGESGLQLSDVSDVSMIAQLTKNSNVKTYAILHENDRIGSVSWMDTPDATSLFTALKEALLPAFTPAVQDLRDQTDHRQDGPMRTILTFLDTGLSEERLVFVRVGNRLYQFSIGTGQEATMFPLIDEVTLRTE